QAAVDERAPEDGDPVGRRLLGARDRHAGTGENRPRGGRRDLAGRDLRRDRRRVAGRCPHLLGGAGDRGSHVPAGAAARLRVLPAGPGRRRISRCCAPHRAASRGRQEFMAEMTGNFMTHPVLDVRDVTKTFFTTDPPAQVLNGIDLTVRAGEFLVVMGASGSGKSTLLYCVSGMDRVTGGDVLLEGRDLTSLGDDEMSRVRLTKMGFVFQQPYFLNNLTIRDNI